MAVASTLTVAEFREVIRALDLQHYDAQNVILRVEMISTASIPRLPKFAFLLFGVPSGDGSWRAWSGCGGIDGERGVVRVRTLRLESFSRKVLCEPTD